MIASLTDHPIVLLVIVAVTVLRWLFQKGKGEAQAAETRTAPPTPPPSQPITRGGETQSEEERIRKFLEALGQPAGTSAPPKVMPRRRQVEPQIFPKLPRLKTRPPPLPPAPDAFASTPPPPPPPPLPVASVPAPETNFEVRDFSRQTSSEPRPELAGRLSSIVKLRTPQDLRTAILLREILGPPRSMQTLDGF